MARRGWAGTSGGSAPWWRGATFYSLDPARFQAVGSDSQGSLAGITERLNYLQALGVDALVLDGSLPVPALDPLAVASGPLAPTSGSPSTVAAPLEDLVRAASNDHIRVLLTIPDTLLSGPATVLLGAAHTWLGQGVAGFAVQVPAQVDPGSSTTSSLKALVQLVRGTPGHRVLLVQSMERSKSPGLIPFLGPLESLRPSRTVPKGQGLLWVTSMPAREATAAAVRASLIAADDDSLAAPVLLHFAAPPPTAAPNAVTLAAALLGSRGSPLIHFGDEIGLDTGSGTTLNSPPPAVVMQWTPANVQQPASPPQEATAPLPGPGQATPLGPYRPFVRPPPPTLIGTVPGGPSVGLDRNLPPALPPLDSLPGFTAGSLPAPPVEGATVNVATEERDPGSVLLAYRRLLALRRGNPALRAGEQIVLQQDNADAVVFVRTAPPGVRTTGSVLVAANLGTRPVVLSLNAELLRLGLHPGPLRALFSYGPQVLTGESAGALRLPPHAVFFGELSGTGHH